MSKIAVIWYWPRASEIFPDWRDGIKAAVELIGKEHQVEWFLDKQVPQTDDYDGLIFWDDSNSSFFPQLLNYPKAKKGIFLTSDNGLNIGNLKQLDIVFCESKPVLKAVLAGGAKGVLGFGTDTDFYSPDLEVKKDIEYFYPATFSPWKKQSNIAYLGDKLVCIGTIQPDGYQELEACEQAGVQIEIGYFPAEKIRDYYRRAKHVIIPAIHGSERTILEAMATDILPEVTNLDNVRAQSYLREYYLSQAKSPRQFILRNYSAKKYAQTILKGLGL